MKKIYLFLFWASIASLARSQNFTLSDNTIVKRCATVEVLADARRNNPRAETDAQFENWINNMIQQRKATQPNPLARLNIINYNLPIIFHIISNGETVGTLNNISQASITQQMLQLNKDFANQSNSPYTVASTTGIQFSLAQTNPSGTVLSEPGIERINRSTYGWTDPTAGWTTTYITDNVKPATIWDPSRYINVWLVASITGIVPGTEVLGYATFPSGATLPGLNENETFTTAGVVIKSTVAGSIFQPSNCANASGKGKTLTHELGHFFGLRHIWGDANCATDYVNDTPIHFTSNSGVPTHPKPNSCGTTDEMFENYMDYSDDVALNTFTVNQVDRMQTVMLNSLRRISLATSNVGLIPATGTNRISFNQCTGVINLSENATTGTYPRYRDINLSLIVDDKATANATVTINTAGTAISATHYQLITPSVLTFAAGDAAKPVTIRILDNAAVDGDKTIILSYTISGTGVIAGTTAQTITITITDDDNVVVGQNTINILSESFESGSGTLGLPAGWGVLATANYDNRFVTSANGDAGGSGNVAHITNNTTLRPNTYTKGTSGLTILQSPIIDPSRYISLGNVSFKYKVLGSATDFGYLTYTLSGQNTGPFYFFGVPGSGAGLNGYGPYFSNTGTVISGNPIITAPDAVKNVKFALNFYWSNGTSAIGGDPGLNVDDLVFTGQPFNIETNVSNSYGYNVAPSTINNFKSINNKVVASLSAVSTPVTSVTAAVTEAGNDRPSFSANGTTYLRTRKVISVGPSPSNTTAQYTVKLYYTAAEVAAWGTSTASLKVMKVNTGINLSSPLNNSNATIVSPVAVEDRLTTDGYIAYTATFTGFGQFVLVDANAVLPVKWLSFTGILDKGKSKLNWKTADEINNKGFEVERSTDATTFEKIGWVDASASNSYELFDTKIAKGNTYYYRLKQVDKDGNYSYSPVVKVTYAGENIISVFPNPVKSTLTIQQSGIGRTTVVITDLTGKTLYTNTFAAGSLNVNAQSWSKGIYMVRVFKDEEVNTFKIIKQ
jgi:hypothetical protein